MIVVDSDVLSELMRPEPSPAVEAWALVQRPEMMFPTVVHHLAAAGPGPDRILPLAPVTKVMGSC